MLPVNRIREVRESRDMERKAFAEKLGISLKHAYMIEAGRVGPSIGLFVRICEVLACAADEVYPKRERAEYMRAVAAA